MHIYNELNEIPVPDFAHSDGFRVYANYSVGNGNTKKIYIGQYANKKEGTFYANDNLRIYFPEEWAKHYQHIHIPHYQYQIGMYAMTLHVTDRIGLYSILHAAFGPLYGNALLDFSMYSIMERSNVAYRFQPAMANQVIFSRELHNDAWLSNLFSICLTHDMILDFRQKWIVQCKETGVKHVWISIDGSNNDNDCKKSELSAKGENKSGKNKNCVGYMYAVDANCGKPVAFSMYSGDTVDSKAFIEMCELLESNQMEIDGIILDRGFLTHAVLDLIKARGYRFVIMLKDDTFGHTQMVIDYGSQIYWNVEHLIGEGGLFGISDGPRKIFRDYEDEGYINLYFDARNGCDRKITFVDKLYTEIESIRKQIDKGELPLIDGTLNRYLRIEKVILKAEELPDENKATFPEKETYQQEGSNRKSTPSVTSVAETQDTQKLAAKNTDALSSTSIEQTSLSLIDQYRIIPTDLCNKMLYKKGFESIASSENLGPKETNRIYHLRDASEKQFMICDSMLGCDVFRVHTTEGIWSKGIVCFIASIIRNEISLACKALNYKPSLMLPQIEKPSLALLGNGSYKYIQDSKETVLKLFSYFGCEQEDFDILAGEVNERESAPNGKGTSQYHRTPKDIREAHRQIHMRKKNAEEKKKAQKLDVPSEEDNEIKPHVPRGRPLGSKNKKTLEREAAAQEGTEKSKTPRKPGRPMGSKNKKTLEREAAGQIKAPNHKRGRPAGSKDSKPRTRRTKKELEEAAVDGK